MRNFRRFLEKKAVLLIQSVAKFLENERKPFLPIKKVKYEILRVSNDVDFALILSVAEKLSPGTTFHVYGTQQEDLEKRFNDLWGS